MPQADARERRRVCMNGVYRDNGNGGTERTGTEGTERTGTEGTERTGTEGTERTETEGTEATDHTEQRRNGEEARPTAGVASRLAGEESAANARPPSAVFCVCAGFFAREARVAGRSR